MNLTFRHLKILQIITAMLTAFSGGYYLSSIVCQCDKTPFTSFPIILGVLTVILGSAAERKKKQESK